MFSRIEIKETIEYDFTSNHTYFFKNGTMNDNYLVVMLLVSGLHAYEAISIRVAAKTIIGQGPFSEEVYFYTSENSMFYSLL